MKYLKLFESFEDIDSICKRYGIENYTINNGTVDVDGNVDLIAKGLSVHGGLDLNDLPFKFGSVSGSFYCNSNELKSLKGSPKTVGGNFYCSNNQLTTLEGAPEYVGGDFKCVGNVIRTLEFAPNHVGGDFQCSGNPVYVLWRLFQEYDKIDLFNDFGITDGEVVILERLNEFLEMIGIRLGRSAGLQKDSTDKNFNRILGQSINGWGYKII